MSVKVLGGQNSIAIEFLNEIRDKELQRDRMRFRNNMQRMGEIMAYEISKSLDFTSFEVQTPLAKIKTSKLLNQPVLITVLRAGLAYFQGFQNFFDQAEAGFIGAYRKEGGHEITINLDYLASPSLEGRELIVIDPMLATGKSFIHSIQALLKNGTPSHIHIASLIASPEGIRFIQENLKIPFTLWTFAIDERLDHRFYIVPGLGDAGDLSYGDKL